MKKTALQMERSAEFLKDEIKANLKEPGDTRNYLLELKKLSIDLPRGSAKSIDILGLK